MVFTTCAIPSASSVELIFFFISSEQAYRQRYKIVMMKLDLLFRPLAGNTSTF